MTNIGTISNYSFNQVRQDPDAYAQEYANKNGMTLEEAKAELKSKYGDPKKPEETAGANSSVFGQYGTGFNNNATSQIDAETDISETFNNLKNPDEFAQFYADENGISLEEAKAELKELKGEPQAPEMNTNANNIEDFIKELVARILDFLRGGNGPQQEGDPEHHKNDVETDVD